MDSRRNQRHPSGHEGWIRLRPCRVPREATDLEVHALLEASELDGSATTGVIYWKGPVVAVDTQSGEGFVEMTGYAGTI